MSFKLEDYAKLNHLDYEVDFDIDKKHEYLNLIMLQSLNSF